MKVGGDDGPMKIDPNAIKRAEQALEENLEKLRKAFADLKVEGGDTEENRQLLYGAAHDLKGVGSTLGYPRKILSKAPRTSLKRVADDERDGLA